MHDGTVARLSDVVDHYAAGGRTIASGVNGGTDSTRLTNPRLSNPWIV